MSIMSLSLLKLISIKLVMPSNHLLLCHALLPSVFLSIRVFSNRSVLRIRWPRYWSFSYSISPSNEYWGLISFETDRFDLLAVEGTLKSLLQHHSSNASILRCSAFFIVQLSHPYLTTGKAIALTRQTFVSRVMSLLFNMLSRLVIAFLQGVSFNFMVAVTISNDFGAQEYKVCHCFHCFPIYLPWSDGETVETVRDFILGGSKITAEGDCSHEIKRWLFHGRKVMTNLDSIFRSRDIPLPTKVHLVQAMLFPVVKYGCESWNIKKAEYWRIDAFELWCWRRLLRVPWTARRSNTTVQKHQFFNAQPSS